MLKDNHGWNFFKILSTEKRLFEIEEFQEFRDGPESMKVRKTFKKVFVGSTDLEQATDAFNHEIAWLLTEPLLLKAGIPKILRGIMRVACLSERKVEFTAEGVMKNFGTPSQREGVNFIKMKKGVMQGDPVTKPILHMMGIVNREIAAFLYEKYNQGTLDTYCEQYKT